MRAKPVAKVHETLWPVRGAVSFLKDHKPHFKSAVEPKTRQTAGTEASHLPTAWDRGGIVYRAGHLRRRHSYNSRADLLVNVFFLVQEFTTVKPN